MLFFRHRYNFFWLEFKPVSTYVSAAGLFYCRFLRKLLSLHEFFPPFNHAIRSTFLGVSRPFFPNFFGHFPQIFFGNFPSILSDFFSRTFLTFFRFFFFEYFSDFFPIFFSFFSFFFSFFLSFCFEYFSDYFPIFW